MEQMHEVDSNDLFWLQLEFAFYSVFSAEFLPLLINSISQILRTL